MHDITARVRRRVAVLTSCLLIALVMAVPAAIAIPIEGTGGPAPAPLPAAPLEDPVRVVTETVSVGVPYLAAIAIGLLAFAAAWALATWAAGHRGHRSAMG